MTNNNNTPYVLTFIDTRGVPVVIDLPPASGKVVLFGSVRWLQKFATWKFRFNLPLASHHSIISSASASNVGGISSPIPFAVFRLMANSNLVDCITGRSAGISPLRTRPV
jgi:hypothetical protein